MDTTLEILPGEGDTETIQRVRLRRTCEYCNSPAHYKHTFLLPNCRSNPASKAYRHDDCTWCSDAEIYTCKECYEDKHHWITLDGYEDCSTFPASARFAHMFLYWKEVKKQ